MSAKMIREVEEKIVGAFVDSALSAGYRLSVSLEKGFDIDEMLVGSTDRAEIMKEAFAGDECHIFVHEPTGECVSDGQLIDIGWVYCVLGNDGWDVISDYITSLENLMTDALGISERYAA